MSSSHFRWNERKSLVKWKLEISLLFIQTKIVLFYFFFLKTAIFSKYLQVGTKQLVTSSIIVPRISLLVDYSSNRVNSLSVVIGCQLLFKGGRRNKKKNKCQLKVMPIVIISSQNPAYLPMWYSSDSQFCLPCTEIRP